MTSITRERILKAAAIIFWIAVWEIFSLILGEEILLPSPHSVIVRLCSIMFEKDFIKPVLFSLSRIFLGSLLSVVSALILASLSFKYRPVELILNPVVRVIRATPVASIIILMLVWIESRNLSVLISFMMVFPVMYSAVLTGLENTDSNLIEVASVYDVSVYRKIRYIYTPNVYPYFIQALSVSLSMAWKSGTAAEIISLPTGSLGEKLYMSKVYLQMPELFAWTIVIILMAYIFEKVLVKAAKWARVRISS